MDIEGRLSPQSQITVILDDTCSQIFEGDTVFIESMEHFEQISLCRGLELNLNIRDPIGNAINSLHSLSNLRVSVVL